MNLLKSKLRRSATVIGGAFLGLAGVAAFAAPALACETEITPISKCANADGSWVVEWQVKNSEWDIAGKITEVKLQPSSSTLTGIEVGSFLPKEKDGVLTGTQKLPADAESARIALQGTWEWNGGGYVSWSDNSVRKPHNLCKPEGPTTPPTGPTTNPPTKPTTNPTTGPTTPPTTATTTGPTTPPTTAPTTTPSVTATPSGGSETPSPAKEPQFIYDNTCDTFTVGLEVPKDWPESITVTFKPSTGDSKTITVKPGATGTVEFPASEGLTVTATPKGYEDEAASIAYETPADCDSNGGGGGLPVTGAAAGGIAGGAAALLAVGGGLFFMARRRKVKFTA
ncbi:cell wall anchor protein [Paractinoplanes durhamensis]|uniref:LPXTG cell wall anchor domain-containing protein n=1 Tax=Paractinoplanes durhamensis TaxID=113563 RepID=A0ABQ3YN04_9ACTN|nr:cell wall anchor protein [Actinoplanes durhamensis]GID98964.1 hypothetical protein Adu01nite_03150 [Actinoplanes durhamensis]